MPDRPVNSLEGGGSAGVRTDFLVASWAFMIDLLGGGRSRELLSHDAAERQDRSIAFGLGKGLPEMRRRNSTPRPQRARGGTVRDEVRRIVILPAEVVRGGAGSIPPASGAPGPRLWGAALRIDKDELQVQPVCFFCNTYKGPNIAGIDPVSMQVARLFHPRKDRWGRHFRWDGPLLVGLTRSGRATIAVLEINQPEFVAWREILIREGEFPPRPMKTRR